MFPGQGTQRAGMLRELGNRVNDVTEIFQAASDISGRDVMQLCLTAPDDILKRTENTQVAVTAMNLAYYTLLQKSGVLPDIVLGHSLGQFSALYAAGVVSLESLFKIIVKRAELMNGLQVNGALCTVLGLSMEQVVQICAQVDPEGKRLAVALHNTEKQIVVGGEAAFVASAEADFKAAGAIRTVPVRVSNAFHTPLMKPMEQEFKAFINSIPLNEPQCQMLLNCKGDYAKNAADIKEDMILQCCHTVHWFDCLQKLLAADDLLLAEVGIGKVLAGMVRNTQPHQTTYLISNVKQFKQFTDLAKK